MATSPASSDLSDPPSVESDDQLSNNIVPSSRHASFDGTLDGNDPLAPPRKRRRTGGGANAYDAKAAARAAEEDDDTISLSSDGWSDGPGSPSQGEWILREEAVTQCHWRDCDFGIGLNNDELVAHVQASHMSMAVGGAKRTRYLCEWGECQRKTSIHSTGYAFKFHIRTHTKEKPIYCIVPECDKSFTRTDGLTKHLRSAHEPESMKSEKGGGGGGGGDGSATKPVKLKLTNGSSQTNANKQLLPQHAGPTHDEDETPVDPSPPDDNIMYTPGHHPITGQPGFMITYPIDIHFSSWESSIRANALMSLLRRQIHWAEQEGEKVKRECAELENRRRQEWERKEVLLERVLEASHAHAQQSRRSNFATRRERDAMGEFLKPTTQMDWAGKTPWWRLNPPNPHDGDDIEGPSLVQKKGVGRKETALSLSPPVAGPSDDEADPYDDILAGAMARYEANERQQSVQSYAS